MGCQDKQGSEVEWDLDEARGWDVRTSRGAVPWKSAQMMGQQNKSKKLKKS